MTTTLGFIKMLIPLAAAGFACLGSNVVFGQVQDPTVPDRGLYPLASQMVTDFETVNTHNGNLVYQFPITKLPPNRRGNDGLWPHVQLSHLRCQDRL